MNLAWKGKRLVVIGAVAVILLTALAFLLFGPPKLLAKSESPEFCAGCHIHEGQYQAYLHHGAHRRGRCVDCHLPNQNVAEHYSWKSIDGMKDVLFFYSNFIADPIRLSRHGAAVVQENCIRCHGEMVYRIDNTQRCWRCHRSITHTRIGTVTTFQKPTAKIGEGGL